LSTKRREESLKSAKVRKRKQENKSQRREKDCQEIPGKQIKSALKIFVPKARSSISSRIR